MLARLEQRAGPRRPSYEWIAVPEALGRIASRPVTARRAVPPHDVSVMDGYALRLRATEGRALPLRARKVIGRSLPGGTSAHLPRVGFTTAVEVRTGATVPPGTNVVVRSEHARRTGALVRPHEAVFPGQNIARKGEDFRAGSRILEAGTRLRPWHVAALLANGVARLRVVRMWTVGILATGGEVVPGRHARPGRDVIDTTKPLLIGLLSELGIRAVDLGIVPDEDVTIARAVSNGIGRCDVVITVGGSSVGERDRVRPAINSLRGAGWVARGIPLRPGSTSSIALVRRRPVFVLAGPPVAALAGFATLVEPYLRAGGLVTSPAPPFLRARLTRKIVHPRGVREIARVRLRARRGVWWVSGVERHAGGRLSSLTRADGLVVLDERRGDYAAGEAVRVRLLRDPLRPDAFG